MLRTEAERQADRVIMDAVNAGEIARAAPAPRRR